MQELLNKINVGALLFILLGLIIYNNGRFAPYTGVFIELGEYKSLVSFGFIFLGFYIMTIKKEDQE